MANKVRAFCLRAQRLANVPLKVWLVLFVAPLITHAVSLMINSFTQGWPAITAFDPRAVSVGECQWPDSLTDFPGYYTTLHCEVEYWLTTWFGSRAAVHLGVIATLLCLPWYAGVNLAIFVCDILPAIWTSVAAGQFPVTLALEFVSTRFIIGTLTGFVLFGFPSAIVTLVRHVACLV